MSNLARRFRIEMAVPEVGGGLPPADREQALRLAICELQALLAHTRDETRGNSADHQARGAEVQALRHELDSIQEAIAGTKQELAALRIGQRGRDVARLTDELDAVVSGTEAATETVLEAAERIDRNAADLEAALGNPAQVGLVADMRDQVVRIFEACNFQDLTGQRIDRIVTTLHFIEQRVEQMMNIWVGLDGVGAGPVLIDIEDGPGESLLNGPKLEGDNGHVSQAEIDALFD